MIKLFDEHTPRLDAWFYRTCMVIARLGLAYLFFTQLWWKLPGRNFGCGSDFAFPVPAAENHWSANGSSGLCFWMGLESVFADQPRRVLIADMRQAGLPDFGVDIAPLARINGALLDNVIIPQIGVFGWLVFLTEAWVFVSMTLGLFTRLGAIASLGISTQLYVGLANIPRPYEFEWTYGLMIVLSIAMLGAAAGRVLGLDAWLRTRFARSADGGSRLARLGLLLT